MKKIFTLFCITFIICCEIKASTQTPDTQAQRNTQELLTIARTKIQASIALKKVRQQANQQLFEAAQTGNFEQVRMLIAQGDVDINTKDHDGKTPLMQAIIHSWYYNDDKGKPKTYQYEQIVDCLLHAGAQWLGADNKGKTATLYAMERDVPYDNIAQMLNQKYFDMIQIR